MVMARVKHCAEDRWDVSDVYILTFLWIYGGYMEVSET